MKMQHIAVLALFSLLLLDIPTAWYTEKLTVQVWDQQYRPVQNAQAYVEYQLNDVAGMTKTKPKPTNESGFAEILFTDYEEINASVDNSYTLYVQYGNQTKTAGLIAENGTSSRMYQMVVEAYYAIVRAYDQKGAPVAANVTINNQRKETDAGGNALFQLPPGSYNVRVEKGSYVRNLDLALGGASGDRSLDALLGDYSLDVAVKDENDTPISSALVRIDGQEISTNGSGMAHFENITDPEQSVTVKYQQYTKKFETMLDREGKLAVVFDLSAPVIKALHVTISKSGAGTVSLFIDDTGPSASGIDSVIVKYTVNGMENSLPTYSTSYDTFEAKIPSQPPSTLVEYLVMITDKEGNIVSQDGNYLVPAIAEQQPQNQSPGNTTEPILSNVSTEMLIGGVVALVIVISAIAYFFRGRTEEGPFGPRPPSIPQAPPEAQKQE